MVPDRGKYMGEKIAAIVLAAGEGKRMGSGIPKQYMPVSYTHLDVYKRKTLGFQIKRLKIISDTY